jgi:L-threonylcarbamoyladenylate synthase
MRTSILQADEPGMIEQAAQILLAGSLVAFPTDTLYGLGAAISSAAAIRRLYRAKGRAQEKGIPVLVADMSDLDQVVTDVPTLAGELIDRYWPGPLTLILPKRADLPADLSPNLSIAVRMPDNEIARRFIRACGGAVATSSANRSGQPPALDAQQAFEALDGLAAVVLDGGPVQHRIASTILDCTVSPPQLLREGPIPAKKLGLAGHDML